MKDNTATSANPTWPILFYGGFSATYFNRPLQPSIGALDLLRAFLLATSSPAAWPP